MKKLWSAREDQKERHSPATERPVLTSGIVAGTEIATASGWRPVEAVAAGDLVMTFDGGLQRVAAISRSFLGQMDHDILEDHWPLVVPAGLIGNRRAMTLLPEETVVLESDMAEMAFGDPFALIPAMALADLPGVERAPAYGMVEVVQLAFEEDQVIFAEGNALLFCPSSCDGTSIALETLFAVTPAYSAYEVLSLRQARALTAAMAVEWTAVAPPPHQMAALVA